MLYAVAFVQFNRAPNHECVLMSILGSGFGAVVFIVKDTLAGGLMKLLGIFPFRYRDLGTTYRAVSILWLIGFRVFPTEHSGSHDDARPLAESAALSKHAGQWADMKTKTD